MLRARLRRKHRQQISVDQMVKVATALDDAGVPLIEIVNLEELSAAKLYEFAFFGACLKLRGATGSPMRPVAMPLRK